MTATTPKPTRAEQNGPTPTKTEQTGSGAKPASGQITIAKASPESSATSTPFIIPAHGRLMSTTDVKMDVGVEVHAPNYRVAESVVLDPLGDVTVIVMTAASNSAGGSALTVRHLPTMGSGALVTAYTAAMHLQCSSAAMRLFANDKTQQAQPAPATLETARGQFILVDDSEDTEAVLFVLRIAHFKWDDLPERLSDDERKRIARMSEHYNAWDKVCHFVEDRS